MPQTDNGDIIADDSDSTSEYVDSANFSDIIEDAENAVSVPSLRSVVIDIARVLQNLAVSAGRTPTTED